MKRMIMVAVMLGLTACPMSTRARHDPVARGPRGAEVRVNTTLRALRGELLAVDDSAVTVLVASVLWQAPYGAVQRIAAQGQGTVRVHGRPLPERVRERLRVRSRFPQGIDAGLLAALLAAYGQDSVMVARP